jgi:uncharacterized short protein YbdD (DUF466 family)
MAYKILPYSFRKAKELGVVIKPSSNLLKKIDVFKNGKKIASIGARGMNDYPTYLEKEKKGYHPKGYANKRRKLYKERHEKDRHIVGSNGYYADKILW